VREQAEEYNTEVQPHQKLGLTEMLDADGNVWAIVSKEQKPSTD